MNEILKRTAAVAIAFLVACSVAGALAVAGHVSWEFVLGVLTVGTTATLGIIQFEAAKDREISANRAAKEREVEARLFPQKSAAYSALIKMFIDMLGGAALGRKKMDDIALARALADARTSLIIWGGSQTIDVLNKITGAAPATGDPLAPIDMFEQLFAAIRVDLGHNDPPGFSREIAFGLIKADDQAQLRKLDAERMRRQLNA